MPSYSLFNHAATPAGGATGTWAADSQVYRFATLMKANVAGHITAIWLYVPDTSWAGVTTTAIVRPVEVVGSPDAAPLYTQSFVGRSTAGWQRVPLDTPLALSIGQRVGIGYARVANISYFTVAGLVSADVFSEEGAIMSEGILANGVYSTTLSPNVPINQSYTDGTWYGTDVEFATTLPLFVDIGLPVAIDSDQTAQLTATTTGGTVPATYTWARVSGPTCTLSPTNAITTTFTPSAAGNYVISVTAVSGAETFTDEVAITVSTPNPSEAVVPTVTTGWTVVGGGTAEAALSDVNTATYLESYENPLLQLLTVRLKPLSPPDGDLVVEVILSCIDAADSTFSAALKNGNATVAIANLLVEMAPTPEKYQMRFSAASLTGVSTALWGAGTLTINFSAAANP